MSACVCVFALCDDKSTGATTFLGGGVMYAASDVCGCVHVVAPSVHLFDAGVMVAVRVVIIVGAAAAIGVWIGVSCGTLAKGCTFGTVWTAPVSCCCCVYVVFMGCICTVGHD